MSRRKQENPQPRKRLVTRVECLLNSNPGNQNRASVGLNQIKSGKSELPVSLPEHRCISLCRENIKAEPEVLQDILTCGVCQKDFALSDIVKFIQHKVVSCNKENYLLYAEHEDYDSDPHENNNGSNGGTSIPIINTRRPSISAPIARRDRLAPCGSSLSLSVDKDLGARPLSISPSPISDKPVNDVLAVSPHSSSSAFGEDGLHHHPLHLHSHRHHHHHHRRGSEVDRDSPRQRSHKPKQVDAESNTTYTEPNNYVCSTCKHSFNSAWMLLQHVQNLHGMKIYVDSSLGPGTPVPPSPSISDHHSHHSQPPQPPTPQPHQLPPQQPMQGPPPPHPHLPLEPHPFLLRLPLAERQLSSALNAHNPFVRPPSHDFRMELINNQFRLHSPGIPGLPPFEHHPFERPALLDRPPRFTLPSMEPSLDFYSKRLRELAGTTSPTASPSPRKLTPPFSSPQPPPSSSQPSTPQPPHAPHTPTPSSTSAAGGGASNRGSESSTPKMKSCEFCGKTFRFQSNLIVHRRSHTGEKPYKCHICNHACTQASKLKRHMKTHLNKSPGSTISENTSVESASSTPDSNGAAKRGGDGKFNNNLEEEGSDAQGSVDTGGENDDEEEDDEDEEELLEEDELGSEAAEDLSTSAKSQHSLSGVSTPLLGSGGGGGGGGGSNAGGGGGGGDNGGDGAQLGNGGRERGDRDGSGEQSHVSGNGNPDRLERQSLLGEVMEKIGLSNIQHYSEAYKQALEESNASRGIKEESRHVSDVMDVHRGPGLVTENGLERTLRLHEDLGKGLLGRPPLDLGPPGGHGIVGAFDNLFNANKRIKLEMGDGTGRERDPLYAGLWLPGVPTSRDIFMGLPGSGSEVDHLVHAKHSSESALKALGLPDANSPKPGPSGNSVGAAVALLGCERPKGGERGHHHHHHHHHHSHHGSGNGGAMPHGLSPGLLNMAAGNGKPKEQRRNDTCEYCGKVFKNCSNLTVHRRSHTGEKPYKCELCSYACAQSSKLTRHMKTHGRLGKDVYRCRFCDMPFSVPSTLEKHMRKCVVNQNSKTSETDTDSKEAT